jgi:hypothetical protein
VKDVDGLELPGWVVDEVRDAAVYAAVCAWKEARGDYLFWSRCTGYLSNFLNSAKVEVVSRLRVHPDVVHAAMEWKGVGPPDPRFIFVRIEFAGFSFWLVFDTSAGGIGLPSSTFLLVLGGKSRLSVSVRAQVLL